MINAEKAYVEVPEMGHLAVRVSHPATPPGAVVILCPALGVKAEYYDLLSKSLAERNVAVVAADLRGQGDSAPRAGRSVRHGYHLLASQDWPNLVAWTRQRFDSSVPLYLLGHSIGGQISVHYSAIAENAIDGLILVASGSVDFRGFRGRDRIKVLMATHFIAAVATLWGYWPGHMLKFAGKQPARLMRDWARIARTGRFNPEGSDIDYEGMLARVRIPILAISLAGDTLAPPEAVDRLCAKLPSSAVERWHHQPAHGRRLDHVRWARHGEEIVSYMRSWMNRNAVNHRQGEIYGQ